MYVICVWFVCACRLLLPPRAWRGAHARDNNNNNNNNTIKEQSDQQQTGPKQNTEKEKQDERSDTHTSFDFRKSLFFLCPSFRRPVNRRRHLSSCIFYAHIVVVVIHTSFTASSQKINSCIANDIQSKPRKMDGKGAF